MVLQSQARESVKKGKTQYYFVTDGIERAIAKARELAGEKNIALHGASAVQQALQAGLLHEIPISGAPILLGEGTPLFSHPGPSSYHLTNIPTPCTTRATQVLF